MKQSVKWAVVIIVIILGLFFNFFFYGFLSFLNTPINLLMYGPVDTHCNTDADCALKQTSCDVSCACPVPVNKNWQRKCIFGYKHPTAACEPCGFVETRCVQNRCTYAP